MRRGFRNYSRNVLENFGFNAIILLDYTGVECGCPNLACGNQSNGVSFDIKRHTPVSFL